MTAQNERRGQTTQRASFRSEEDARAGGEVFRRIDTGRTSPNGASPPLEGRSYRMRAGRLLAPGRTARLPDPVVTEQYSGKRE